MRIVYALYMFVPLGDACGPKTPKFSSKERYMITNNK